MSTRRFEEGSNPNNADTVDTTPSRRSAPGMPVARSGRGGRHAPHMPRTMAQVMNEANDDVVRGNLSDYLSLPTGFDPLDGMIGGGLRKTELILFGGAQGIGKTVAALQIARNIAS